MCRWLHIYLAMSFLALLLFFCITGITLNHTDWFSDDEKRQTVELMLPQTMVEQLSHSEVPDTAMLVRFIEEKTRLTKPRSIDISLDLGEISFDYPLPAAYAFATYFIGSNELEIEHKPGSAIMLLNDLHKGRHSGDAWSLVIDISAIAIALFSVTGLIILFQHQKRKYKGLMAAFVGLSLPIFIYVGFVPVFSI